ncbi:hypothetical protein HY412_02360 [Candidatus Kaiserbacteria bacterium]|nr:hypothetical protein [Candidatus Kaiserbacteria bacterium]
MKGTESRQFVAEQTPYEHFAFPNLLSEIGEIERVADIYAPDNKEEFIETFQRIASRTKIEMLTENEWSKLENTDSYNILTGDWVTIIGHVQHYNTTTNADRDWQELRNAFESGKAIDAPIILKTKSGLHLISGNTRLMMCRAFSIRPKVLIIDMSSSF